MVVYGVFVVINLLVLLGLQFSTSIWKLSRVGFLCHQNLSGPRPIIVQSCVIGVLYISSLPADLIVHHSTSCNPQINLHKLQTPSATMSAGHRFICFSDIDGTLVHYLDSPEQVQEVRSDT